MEALGWAGGGEPGDGDADRFGDPGARGFDGAAGGGGALAGLAAAIDRLAGEDLEALSDAEAMDGVAALRRLVDRAEAQWLRRVGAADRREAWRADGALSPAAALRHRCRLAPGAAADRALVARRLGSLPATAAAFAAGDMSYAHARLIARAAIPGRAAEATRDEPILAQAAARLCPKLLGSVVRRWVDAVDPDGSLSDAERAYGSQHLHLARLDGRGVLRGEFDAEATETLAQALDGFMTADVRGDADAALTSAQRRAHALIDMARAALVNTAAGSAGAEDAAGGAAGDSATAGGAGASAGAGHARPDASVTVDWPTLARAAGQPADPHEAAQAAAGAAGATLAWGGPITAETARRLLCDATVARVITGPHSQPLNVGRATRTVSSAQRRALAIRDEGCRFPGCDHPPGWTDAHHITHWAHGGPTNLENLILLCRRHHRAVHEGGWRITRQPDGGHTFTRGP